MPAGLYVHVPFCKRRCGYCDFYAEVSPPSVREQTVEAILREADLRAPQWEDCCFETVFIGGGTPSHLGASLLERLLMGLRERLVIRDGAEWTIEANPESADSELLDAALQCGVNRLSLGVQSFDDSQLRLLNRLHDATTARVAVHRARAAGFANLNLDLIYGLPEQGTPGAWERSLHEALSLDPDHLSCYLLSLEPHVPAAQAVASGTIRLPGETACRAAYDLARRLLRIGGFDHYEISSWSKTGQRCRHNLNVWEGGEYLGLGPGAHGFRHRRRWANLPELTAYLDALAACERPSCSEEVVDRHARGLERILLGLRLREGLTWGTLVEEIGAEPTERLRQRAALWGAKGLLDADGSRLRIAEEGLFVSDALVADLVEVL